MNPVLQQWPPEFAARYRAVGYWRGETFGGFLRERAASHPDRIAVVDRRARWSYAELDRRADSLAAGFLAHGIRDGDRVIVQLPNRAEFVSVIFALFRIGALPVYALPAHRRAELIHFARTAEASAYVVVDSHDGFDYRLLADEVVAAVPSVGKVFVAGDPGRHLPLPESGHVLPDGGLGERDPASVAFMQLSGGSTGLSKLIPRTHDDYLYSIRGSNAICGIDRDSVYLAVLPMAHNFPMSSPGFLGALHAGGRVVLAESPLPDAAFDLIEVEGVTITSLVPPLALVWLEAAATAGDRLRSLRVLQVGGARLPAEVARRIEPAFGCRLQQVFGMAEGLVNYTRLDDPDEVVIRTQGRPISPDDEVLIVDDEGRPVADGTVGHLLTRGPYTIRRYHAPDEINRAAFTADGFYRTGDLVVRDAAGNLEVRGRAKDQINRGGEKLSADEIEEHLLAHPAVHDAIVVALPDPVLGERSCAVVVPSGTSPAPAELKRWIRERGLAAFKVPDRVVFRESLPTTAVGKISRRELREIVRSMLMEQ